MEWTNKKGVPYTQPAQHIMFTPRKKKVVRLQRETKTTTTLTHLSSSKAGEPM